ncbi:MAG: universal stress protein, partial [Thermodesulfobacteriota bacterium]|nr:universal stress protein [Thermodesulfobacteriota bacterium]
DETKIRYASLVSRLASSEEITFIHVRSVLDVEADSSDKSHGVPSQLSHKLIEEQMRELVAKYCVYCPISVKIEYEIFDESQLIDIEILRRIKEKDIDLIVVGKISGEFTAEETIPVKVTRKAPCSALYIPRGSWPGGLKPSDTRILVPVEFSEECSVDAMQLAIDFATRYKIADISCVHAFDVPLGYYKRGKSYEEFSEIMRKNAEKRLEEFKKGFDFKDISLSSFLMRLEGKHYEAILEVAKKKDINLIVIGERRKKVAAQLLLYSVTEQLVRTTTVPLLSVIKRGKGMSFFEALLRI